MGQEIYNQTAQWSNSPKPRGVGTDYKGADAVGMAEGLKKPLVYYDTWTYNANSTTTFWVEDGSYLKVRELSVSYELPSSLIQSIPLAGTTFDAARLSLIGRNLLTFTPYRGFDPEVGFGSATGATGETGSAANTRFAAFQYPNYRTVSASVEITF